MSRSSAVVRPVSPAHAFLYSATCLALAGAGLASGRVVEAVLLLTGVLAYLLLARAEWLGDGSRPPATPLRPGASGAASGR